MLLDLALVLLLFLLHCHSCKLELVLTLLELSLTLNERTLVLLLLLTQVSKSSLHFILLALNSLFLGLLAPLGLKFLLLKLRCFLLELNVHGCSLLLKLLLLLLIALFLNSVLLGQLSEFDLIEGHVPVDGLHILHLLLHGIVGDNKGLRAALLDALETILLDQLPGELLLLLLGHLRLLVVALLVRLLLRLDKSVDLAA